MQDIFDQIAPDSTGDIFDEIAPEAKAPSFRIAGPTESELKFGRSLSSLATGLISPDSVPPAIEDLRGEMPLPEPSTWQLAKEFGAWSPLSYIPNLPVGPSQAEKSATLMNPVTLPTALLLGPEKVAQAQRSAVNAAKGIGEFLVSPFGAATAALGGGVAGRVIATLTKLGFAGKMAEDVGAQAGEIVGGWDNFSELERTDRLTHLGINTAMAAALAKHSAPEAAEGIARFVESDAAGLARMLEEQVKRTELRQPLIEPEAQRRLGIRLTAEPFLQPGIPELADQALREAQSPLVLPEPAIEQLRRELEPPRITPEEPTVLAERIQGGGESPYGKVSFMREAEAPTTERTQAITEAEKSELQKFVDEEAEAGLGFEQKNLPEGVSYRRPRVTTQEEYNRRLNREAIEAGLNLESGYYLDEPRNAPLPEPEPQAPRERQGVTIVEPGTGRAIEKPIPLSALQKSRLRVALARGASEEVIKNILRLKPKPAEVSNALQPESPSPVRSVRDQPIEGQAEVPAEISSRPADEGGNLPVEEKPVTESPAATTPAAPETPKTAAEAPSPSAANLSDQAIAAIENWQAKLREGAQGGQTMMGVPHAILDTALEAARLTLKAGKPLADAIEAAIKHIRYNVKGFDENKVRSEIERELRALPVSTRKVESGAPIEKPAAKPPVGAGETLDDVYRIFEPKPKESELSFGGVKRKAVQAAESLATGLSTKFRPLNKLAEDIAKAHGNENPKNIAALFEQLKGSRGRGEADIYRFDRDVSSLVKGSEKDFNAYMFLRRSLDRLQQDARDIAGELASPTDNFKINRRAVAGYTIRSLESKLALLEKNLGPEKLKQFQTAADRYQQYMDNALQLQVESGRMSPEIYAAIKSGNQFYAPFKVMKYLEETSKPSGTGRKIDTVADFTKAMTGITDGSFRLGDMLAAGRHSLLMSRILADKNQAMRNISDLAVQDTEHRFVKPMRGSAELPQGFREVNVMEGGKINRYAVNSDVADAIQSLGDTGGGVISKVLGAIALPFKAGATTFNLPFQISNLLADVPRQALVSKYGIRGVSDLIRYPLDLAHSLYSSIAGDVLGRDNKLFLDFLDSGAAGTTIQEYLTPKALQFQEPTAISKSTKLAKSVLNVIPEFAAAIEQTSKILGVKRAMRFEGVESGQELAKKIPEAITEIRRFSGSPDFGRQGKWVEQARLNLLYMFLNARLQGAIADVGRLAGRDGAGTAAKTWARLAAAIGVPTAYAYYLNNHPDYKADYDKRPQQEKDNYWLIPKDTFITTEDGEKIRDYWRIPKRESAKWIANMTESALKFAETKDAKSAAHFGQQMLEDISPVNIQGNTGQERLESVGASLNPMLKAPLEFATGRDMYRHRQLVPDTMKKASPEEQYTERTPEVFKKLAGAMPDVTPEVFRSPIMLENLTRNLTAGLITQFLPRKPIQGRSTLENNPLLQRFQALPYTDQQEFKVEMEQLERSAADEFLKRHRQAKKLMEDNPSASLKELVASSNKDPKLIRHLADLYVAKENGATQKDRQIIGLPAEQRAQYVISELKNLNPDEKKSKIRELARKRILTEAVADEMLKLGFK